jgi:hypothetical protein
MWIRLKLKLGPVAAWCMLAALGLGLFLLLALLALY